MAIGSSIYKANINLANLNEHIYDDVNLTLALHPSETEERLIFRIAAFLICYQERLEFTKGLSDSELPDIWLKNYTGDIEHWIDMGQVDEKRIRKACGQAKKVSIFSFQSAKSEPWFAKIKNKIYDNKKLQIIHLEEFENAPLSQLVERAMNLNCIIEDNHLYLGNESNRVGLEIKTLKS